MTVKEIELEKISLSDMKILKLLINTLTVDDKYSFLNRGNFKAFISNAIIKKKKKKSRIISPIFEI